MELFYIIAGVVLLSVIAVVFFFFRKDISVLDITVASLVALLLPMPVYGIGTAIAKENETTFHEYWNGFEASATSKVDTCTRDGICHYEYDCDPYQEIYYVTVTDSEGNTRQDMRTRTEYHSCPYSTTETTWHVQTTLGTYEIARHQTGEQFRWDTPSYGVNIQNDPPKFWVDAKARIDSGNPAGVTKVNSYKNYILASDATILKEYSDVIQGYSEQNLLPVPASGVSQYYMANKTHWVGFNGKNSSGILDADVINEQVSKLGGAMGMELQGDLHMLFVNSDKIKNPDEYAIALKAYWASPEHGRDAIAKNTVTIVVGVTEEDGEPIVDWSRMFTGMPVGNEGLENDLSNKLDGLPVDAELVGSPTYDVKADKVNHSDGAIESILYGENKFQRVSMSADEADDHGSGFNYLADAWEPSAGTMTTIYIISSIMMVGVLIGGFFISLGGYGFRNLFSGRSFFY